MKLFLNFIFKSSILILFSFNAFAYSAQDLEKVRQDHEDCISTSLTKMFSDLSCGIKIDVEATELSLLNYCTSKVDNTLNSPRSQDDFNTIRNLNETINNETSGMLNSKINTFNRNCELLNALKDQINGSSSDILIFTNEGAL